MEQNDAEEIDEVVAALAEDKRRCPSWSSRGAPHETQRTETRTRLAAVSRRGFWHCCWSPPPPDLGSGCGPQRRTCSHPGAVEPGPSYKKHIGWRLASTPGDFPDVLGLVWARVPLSWFGSTWGLHLVSAQGLLPNNLAADGSGPLSGLKFYTLVSVNPASGHRYEAVLSYDPLSGAVALRVGDVTEGRTLVERGLTLAPYSGVYYSTPAETGSHMVVDVHRRFEPYGLNWRLVQPEPDGVHISVDVVDRRRPVHVRLLSPWNELPGGVRLQIGASEIGRIEGIGNETLFPLVLDGLPAGHYDARLDYLYRDEVVASFVRPFHLGVVEARLEGIEIHVGGPDEIQIRGDVVLTADGPVRDVTVALDAVLSRVELEARDYGTTLCLRRSSSRGGGFWSGPFPHSMKQR